MTRKRPGVPFGAPGLSRLSRLLKTYERQAYLRRKRARLKCSDFSIICLNCIGGIMYHDLGLEYLTPTVNFAISMPDLLKMVGDLKWYMEQPLVELGTDGPYFVARLGEGDRAVQVTFGHYDTFQEAAEKWEERKRKINYDRKAVTMRPSAASTGSPSPTN